MSKYHDLVDGVVMKEEHHHSPGVKGVGPDVHRMKSEGFLAAIVEASDTPARLNQTGSHGACGNVA